MSILRLAVRRKCLLAFASAAAIGFGFQSEGRADISFNISSAVGADVDFVGAGTGGTFSFMNNGSGEGFQVGGTTGNGSADGLFGTISGAYTYSTASIVTQGPVQSAPVTSVTSDIFTITDSSNVTLTATINLPNIETVGSGGGLNISGLLNLANPSYSGTNADLLTLLADMDANGGIAVISFNFTGNEMTSLKNLAKVGSNRTTSYSGNITASGSANIETGVPEPTSLTLGCIALGTIALAMSRRRARRA